MKLYLKSPIRFLLHIVKWVLIFSLIVAIHRTVSSEFQGFILLLKECIRMIFISFPLIYSLAFLDVLIFLMTKDNDSYLPIITLIVPFLLIIFILQPIFYAQTLNIASYGQAINQTTTYFNLFAEFVYSVDIFAKEVHAMLDEVRQVYFESYSRYIFTMLTYVFFLFSLSLLTIKAKWKMFNVVVLFFLFRFFTYIYGIMNIHENGIVVFGFLSHDLKGTPTNIINMGYACILYVYGIVSRLKVS